VKNIDVHQPKDFCVSQHSSKPLFSFGLIADVQYCDRDTVQVRHYRNAAEKLRNCIEHFNDQDLAFVVQLGDLIDRDFESFDVVLPAFRDLKTRIHHVLGNHDLLVPDSQKDEVVVRLGLKRRYYEFAAHGWRCLVLDGNELSLYAHAEGSPEHERSVALYEELLSAGAVQAKAYNGGIDSEQLDWLDAQLRQATLDDENVIVFCHFPVFPLCRYNLWNYGDLIRLLSSHDNVAAYICGHKHAGDYGVKAGIHFLTLRGMVETSDESAYAIADVYENRIGIRGFGREPSRSLPVLDRTSGRGC
jgi:calcineurin-like phosphoesterase family protein